MSGSNSAERKRYEPLVLVETADLSEEDWLDYRRRGIGGSDVSAIFGTSPFRTARDLYYDKLNIASVEDDEGNWVAMEMGHLLEPLVAKIFERKTGYRVYQIKKMFQHPQYVKVEGTSFTVSEPFTPLEIEPILYTYATEEQRNILQSQYNVAPFMINTIRLERIFADKIFAAEFYYERKMYFDVAKHLYDVSVMFDLEQIQEMIQNQQTFLEMLGYKRLEETRRTGSDLAEKKFSDFQLLRGFSDNEALRKDYQNMQRNYVFAEEDALSFGFVVEQWKKLGEVLLALE